MESQMEKIVSLCKRRGFVFPGSEISGGLSGTWDLGPLGSELVHNIKDLWWSHFVKSREDMFGLTSSVLTSEPVFRASGHLEGFNDPMVECKNCKSRFRADQIDLKEACIKCGKKNNFTEARQFNMMFKTHAGATESEESSVYLRPEIAQGMFVNFKNVLDTMHPPLPFGIAQIGKAFRNEIAPRDFLFRAREFDLMEFEYFVREAEWEGFFEMWRKETWSWIEHIGIDKDKVHELEVSPEDRAHYSKRTVDFEFDYPFGKKELYGLAYRGNYDLKKHTETFKVDLQYTDSVSGEKFIPHVIEPTFGLGRTLLAVLLSAYTEDELGGEKRIVLKLKPKIAPVKVAVFPLVKNKENIVAKAREVYQNLRHTAYGVWRSVAWDDNGNIGKRYRRQDEIGTPWCVTIDYQTLEDNTVTVRDRDTGEQTRQSVDGLDKYFKDMLK